MERRQRLRVATVAGLLVGAAGIGMLWAGGVEFPVAIPPGIVILLVGAAFVALAPWRWAPAIGILLGAFITVGFLVSPNGIDNLTGQSGAVVAVGQAVQLVGVIGAMVAGVLALRAGYAPARLPG
ncbi:hypothetical protein [Actinoplanes sp. NPDC026623]|uniref:hypothetical protein n=1 Tax=Actinoplanes sp. NPDC026623 TaxID=3155610 RepID=UPI0033CE8041